MGTQNYEIRDFTRIEAGGAFKVRIERADTFQVTVSAEDLAHVSVEKAGDTIYIKRQGIEWLLPFHGPPVATIALPVLAGLRISGATECIVRDFQGDTDLEAEVSGASHVQAHNMTTGALNIRVLGASSFSGDIKARKDVRFEINGASKIELDGSGSNAKVTVCGASKAELAEFALQSASLDITGASNARVNLNGKLDANVAGASHLYWSGTPMMGIIRTSGASTLSSR
jgi:hypothetical protein